MRRLEGWEDRLADILMWAADCPYQLGQHDCFTVACAVVKALTGVNRWPEFEGRYSTKEEALALLAQWGPSFVAAGSRFFGAAATTAAQARRGDICAIRDATGEMHLAVVIGTRLAALGPDGLRYYSTDVAVAVWRVG